jgi:hypothetical protein
MTSNNNIAGFIAFRRDATRKIIGYLFAHDRSQFEKWKRDLEADGKPIPNEGEQSSPQENPSDIKDSLPSSLLIRFTKSMTAFHRLVDFATSFGPLMSNIYLEDDLFKYASENLSETDDEQNYIVYECKQSQFLHLKRLVDEHKDRVAGYEVLPSATLLSLVATFDSLFADIIRMVLINHPERYTNSEKQISLKELFTKSSIEEVFCQSIDSEIDELMRGSHAEQVTLLKNT